jgi:WhiB family redox-sensing transcriptional regulator
MATRQLPFTDKYIPPTPWADDGACKGKDPAMWFPLGGNTWEERKIIREAIKICETCPVQQECLDHSLAWEQQGIWGGKTQRERDAIRRQRNIALSMIPIRVRKK